MRKQVPRSVDRNADFEVVQLADHSSGDQLSRLRDVRGKPQLGVDCRSELLTVAHLQQSPTCGKILTERFLNQHRSTIRKGFENLQILLRHQRDVIHGISRGSLDRIVHRIEYVPDAIFVGECLGPSDGAVVDSKHWESRLAIRGKMRVFDNAPSPEDNDWSCCSRRDHRVRLRRLPFGKLVHRVSPLPRRRSGRGSGSAAHRGRLPKGAAC